MNEPFEASSNGDSAGRIHPEDEDTVELQLSAEDVALLTRAAEAAQTTSDLVLVTSVSPPAVAAPRALARVLRTPRKRTIPLRTGALVLSAASAVALSGTIAYLATDREPKAASLAVTDSHASVPEESSSFTTDAPVRFQNPFDATEHFEFPPGTSEQEAHDAVAELLLKRALERQNPTASMASASSGTSGHDVPVTGPHLIQRD